jgi:hypothetical protein
MFCIHSLRGLVTAPAPAVHPDTVVGTAAHAAELHAFHTVHGVFSPAISDCCCQDCHVTLSAVRVPCQGPLELYQQAHAVVATGRPARAAVVDNSAVL